MSSTSMSLDEAVIVLGLDDDFDLESIQAQFRTKAKNMHPDTGGSGPDLRRLIDARDVAFEALRKQNLEAEKKSPQTPRDEIVLTISIKEAFQGGERFARIGADQNVVPEGSQAAQVGIKMIKIRLPKGLRNEDKLRVPNPEPDKADYVFRIRIDGEDHCRAWGDDLWMTAKIDPRLFYFGGVAEVETPRGPQRIDVTAGTSRGSSLTIKGMGLPSSPTRAAGDLIIRLEARERPIKAAHDLLRDFIRVWA